MKSQINIGRVSGVTFKIGGKLYSEAQLVGKSLYTTKPISFRRSKRWKSYEYETINLEAGDLIGVYYSFTERDGKPFLLFDFTAYDPDLGRDRQTTYAVQYTPGLLDLDAVKEQGVKDTKTEAKEEEEKKKAEQNGGLNFPNPFEGLGATANKVLLFGGLAIAGALAYSILKKS